MERAISATACPRNRPPYRHTFAMRLPLFDFYERMDLLAKLELPLILCFSPNPSAPSCRMVIRHIQLGNKQLTLGGEDFSASFEQETLGAIWLVNNPASAENPMSLEIYNTAGFLIARIFGLSDSVDRAVWEDVMGNPLLSVN